MWGCGGVEVCVVYLYPGVGAGRTNLEGGLHEWRSFAVSLVLVQRFGKRELDPCGGGLVVEV